MEIKLEKVRSLLSCAPDAKAIALEMKPEMRSHFLLDDFSGVRSLE